MKALKLIVENGFVETRSTSKDLGIRVFGRVFNKVLTSGGPIGKVHPIYLKIGDTPKLFGVLTLNNGGSYSFFPEFPEGLQFDHITFVRDLKKGNHHCTNIASDGNEKVLPIFAEEITSGMYHGASFEIGKTNFLKDAPRQVIYPEVKSEHLDQIRESFLTVGKFEGSSIIDLGTVAGKIYIQFFLIPKGTDYTKLTAYPHFLKRDNADFHIEEGTFLSNSVIPHEYQDDYALGIVAFSTQQDPKDSLKILFQAKKDGFYSKIDILKK